MQIANRRSGGLLLGLLLLTPGAGCSREPVPIEDLPAARLASRDPWRLEVKEYGRASAYLGNGYLGIMVSQEGAGVERSKPLDSFISGCYRDEAIAPGPQWAALDLRINDTPVTPDGCRVYEQVFDLRRGLITTRYQWRGRPRAEVAVTVFPARHDPRLGVLRVEVTPARRCRVSIGDVPAGTGPFQAVVLSREEGGATPVTGGAGAVPLAARESWAYTRYAGVCAERDSPEAGAVARASAEAAAEAGYDAVLKRHTDAWERLWARDVAIEGDPAAQQVINALRYYLLASVAEGRGDSVPPMGLSSAVYQGHIFWDADVWVFPALVPQYPELARSIVEYRYRTLPAALENARRQGLRGADYAWESAATGKETVGGEFPLGRHVNAGIALAHWQYYLWTGDREWLRARGFPVLRATADYWVSRSRRNPSSGRYEILNVMGPDETRGPVDNNAWTNSMAQLNLQAAARAAALVGAAADPRWSTVADGLLIPFDAKQGRYEQCPGDDERGHKQADCELLIYPRRLAMKPEVAARTFDYYKERVSKFGPAMTTSIYSVIAARLGRAEEAGKLFRDSYQPFLLPPYHLFSEKRTSARPCFVTGLAGTLQAVLYGFAGLDPTEQGLQSRFLLPPEWKRLRITGVRWRGQTMDLDSGA